MHEDEREEDVEEGPQGFLEDLELQRVDVAHSARLDAVLVRPEELRDKMPQKLMR